MKKAILAFIASSAFAAPAFAADCTVEDMQAKATELTAAIQTLAATDPAKMQELSTAMAEIAGKSAGDMNAMCDMYDELIAEAQS